MMEAPKFTLEFTIPGKPATKGSYVVGTRPDGGSFVKNDSSTLKTWTEMIKWEASVAMRGKGPFATCEVYICVARQRPQRKVISAYPCIKPDVDKVARAALDAMTGIVYPDDCCVVELHVCKYWWTAHETIIKVRQLLEP